MPNKVPVQSGTGQQRTTDYGGDGTFSVKRVADGVTVLSGTLYRKGNLWDKWFWEGDFGALTTDGDYYISATIGAESANSYGFTIGNGTLFSQTGQKTYEYFWTQRCGCNVPGWHNLCHMDDGFRSDNMVHINATGGWHDAGDYNKFPHGFAANALFDLLWLYDSNRSYFDAIDNIDSSGGFGANGIPDAIDEALHQARWLAKMVDSNGHVLQQTRMRRSGASWVRPESDTNNSIGDSDDRWIDPGNEDTPQEAVCCAALIKMHQILDSKGLATENFANKALSIWNHRVAVANAQGGHNNLGSAAHQIWAGLDLYDVYGQQDCWDRAVQRVDELANSFINNPAVFDDMMYAEPPGYELGILAWFARTYPTAPPANISRTAVQAMMDHNMSYLVGNEIGLIRRVDSEFGGGGLYHFPTHTNWNGFFLGINRLYGLLTWAAIESYKTIGNANYLRFAMDQYNWVMGENYNRVCMMEGVGDWNVPRYHTRYDKLPGHSSGKQPGCVMNGYVREYSTGLPKVDLSGNRYQTNEGWLINNAGYAMALSGMTVFAANPQSAYSGVVTLPGTIQAENYDKGGEGIAFHDRSIENAGGAYRSSESVDIEITSDTGGGYNIGWIESGEWLEYSINVSTEGYYNFNIRAATPNNGCSFHLLINGWNASGVTSIPNTGAWQTWTTVAVNNIYLNAGQQTLCIYVDTGGWNLNYIQAAVSQINNAQYISDTIPTTMTAGQQYNVSVTMKNTGTTTWTRASEYKLGGVNDSDPFASTRHYLDPADSIAPNQTKTFYFTMTAPSSSGTYTTDWRMVKEFVEWFGDSLVKQVQVVSSGPVAISNSTFDANADGWATSTWKSGPYDLGTMGWSSSAGRVGGGMRCTGSGATDNFDRCNREGGEIFKAISTVGYSGISVSYDLRVNTLGSNETGVGAGTCVVDHNLIDEQLTVYYSTNGGISWTEATYITRSTLLNYTSYGTRSIDLSGISAVNNNANFMLRFRWQINSTVDVVDLDNIKVIGTP